MRTTANALDVKHDESAYIVADQLHTGRPIRIIASRGSRGGEVPGAHDQTNGAQWRSVQHIDAVSLEQTAGDGPRRLLKQCRPSPFANGISSAQQRSFILPLRP